MKIVRTDEEARAVVAQHIGEAFAFDIETTGLEFNKHATVGLALHFSSGSSYYITRMHTAVDLSGNTYLRHYVSDDTFRSTINALLFQTGVEKRAHNGKFDLKFLKYSWMETLRIPDFVDTLLAAVLLNENRRNGLKDLAETVLGEPYDEYKSLPHYPGFAREEFLGVPLEHAAVYAMKDVETTWTLGSLFKLQIKAEGLEKAYYKLWIPMTFVLAEMEMAGLSLDLEQVQRVYDKYKVSHAELYRKLYDWGMDFITKKYTNPLDAPELYWKTLSKEEMEEVVEFEDGTFCFQDRKVFFPLKRGRGRVLEYNPNGDKQVEDFLFTSRFKVTDDLLRTKSGAISTGKDNIETLLFYSKNEEDNEILRTMLEYSKQDKFLNSYLVPFLDKHDKMNYNSMYTTFNQDVARTGRLSSSNINLQQIPARDERGKEARAMFVARPGHKLLVADYEQFELHLLAHYSQDPVLTEALMTGKDLHILTAADYAGVSYDELLERYNNGDSEAKKLRFIGKTTNFSSMYGIGAVKLRRYILVNNKIDLTEKETYHVLDRHNETYAGVKVWKFGEQHDEESIDKSVVGKIKRNGYARTIIGRRRRLPEIYSRARVLSSRAERQGINAIIQGSCGDIIGAAMIYIQDAISKFGARLLVQVHDELVVECPDEHVEVVAHLMETLMTEPFNKQLRVPLKAEVGIGSSWAEAKA
jgi:DNA polymerase-1